ncbi:MAG: exodeoxyribonuclease V subunit gamma [Candidatus Delongbacteria bacterium]|nr:exodeoxyribonuclease V subunit gamma [Candidatus Delongbacteria bacterium]
MFDPIIGWSSEQLLEALADNLDRHRSVLARRTVIVPSKGLGRWLSQELASRRGLSAGLHLPFASTWLWELAAQLLPDFHAQHPVSSELLLSHILNELPAFARDEALPQLAPFLQSDHVTQRQLELARLLADSLDQLQVHRPDWLLAWADAAPEADAPWQARLWHRVTRALPAAALRPRLLEDLQRALTAEGITPPGLPERLHLFLPASLPDSQFQLFKALARHIPVHLYLLRARQSLLPAPWPLLPGLDGDALEQELDQQLRECGAWPAERHWPDPTGFSCAPGRLGQLQARLQGMVLPAVDGAGDTPDHSLALHSCHSLWRELEVLQDELLRLFDTLEDLHPDQILVLCADLPSWAPAIEAVFGRIPRGSERPALPYTLSRRNSPAEAWQQLLDSLLALAGARLGAEDVLTLARQPLLAACLGLTADDHGALRDLVAAAGIRWGLDGQQQSALELPSEDGQSWEVGLERLLIGLAAPPDTREPQTASWLPDGTPEPVPASGSDARRRIGALAGLLRQVASWQEDLAHPRSLADWLALVARWLGELMATLDGERALEGQRLLASLGVLEEEARAGAETRPLDHAAFRGMLAPRLEPRAFAGQFLDGRITFGEMTALAGVPARVICLLGLNDGEFPRISAASELDLTQGGKRHGDRDPRREDRLLFRQALLGAREVLYLSWCGRDARHNTERAACGPVRSLLDWLDCQQAGDGRSLPVIQHPLQPFHAALFHENAPRRSYRDDLATALARRAAGQLTGDTGLYTYGGPTIPELPESPGGSGQDARPELALSTLVRYWGHPARSWLQSRYRLKLQPADEDLPQRESFAIESLEGWSLRQQAWPALLSGQDPAALRASLHARGLLPGGRLGHKLFAELEHTASGWKETIADLLPGCSLLTQPRPLDGIVHGLRLRGTIECALVGGGRLVLHASRLSARRLVQDWLEHLVWNACDPEDLVSTKTGWSLVLFKETQRIFQTRDDASALLEPWLAPWLGPRNGPAPFAPACAMAWVQALAKAGDADPREKVLDAWQGGYMQAGEGEDPWNLCAWGTGGFLATPELETRFAELAELCLTPLLDHALSKGDLA